MDKSRELPPTTSLGGQRLHALSVLSIFRYQTLNVYYPSLISTSTLYIFHFRLNVERYKHQGIIPRTRLSLSVPEVKRHSLLPCVLSYLISPLL